MMPPRDKTIKKESKFPAFSNKLSEGLGAPTTFIVAIVVVVLWAITGPLVNFSTTWQLFINTGTTIFTFLAMFLLQHSQNADTKAVHLKLDELIRAVEEADDSFMHAERVDSDVLEDLDKKHEDVLDSTSNDK